MSSSGAGGGALIADIIGSAVKLHDPISSGDTASVSFPATLMIHNVSVGIYEESEGRVFFYSCFYFGLFLAVNHSELHFCCMKSTS